MGPHGDTFAATMKDLWMTRFGRRNPAYWALLAAGLSLSIAACAATEATPKEPLVADPPLSGAAALEEGVAATELSRGIAYVKNEKFEEAKGHFEKALEAQPSSVEAAFYLGVAREQTGDRMGAEDAYKRALASDPKSAEAAGNLSALYLDEPSRPADAIGVLEPAVAASPGNAQLLQNLAYAHSLQGDVEGASKAYDAAIAKADSADLRFAYGSMLFEAKKLDRAAIQLKKALELTKDDVPTLATLGRMLGHAGAFGDCVAALDRAIKAKADDPELFVRRGVCKHELEDERGARADYEAAIKVAPKFAAAHYYLGLSLLADKRRLQAIKELELAVSLGAETSIGKLATEKLAGLKKKK